MSWLRRERKRIEAGPAPQRQSRIGSSPGPIIGVDTDGQPVSVDPPSDDATLTLLFLTTSCEPCRSLWAWAAAEPQPGVWIVTPSPETESRRKARELAQPSAKVVMSSPAWHQFGVTGSPWMVVIKGDRIVGDVMPTIDSQPGPVSSVQLGPL